jgi:hypothetical protein
VSTLLLVFDHAIYNLSGLSLLSVAYAEQRESEKKRSSLGQVGHGMRTGGLGVYLRFIRPGEFWGVKAPKASRRDITGMFILQASPSDVEGKGTELGVSGRGG